MIGQTLSMIVSLFTSCERVRGDDTMAQAPKCERVSARLRPGSSLPPGPCRQPTSSMSGYAQHPGLDRPFLAHWTVVWRLATTLPYDARTSSEVRKKFQGHQVALGTVLPPWQFSIMTGRPVALSSFDQRSRSSCVPQPSSFTASKPKSVRAATSLWYMAGVAGAFSLQMQLF